MKTSIHILSLLVLCTTIAPVSAGFKGAGADGEDLGRPARPNPTPGARPLVLPADPVGDATKNKMKQFICDQLVKKAKKTAGKDEWDLLQPAQQATLFEQKLQQLYDMVNPPPNNWGSLTPLERQQKLNQFMANARVKEWIECLIFLDLGCALYDALTPAEKEDLKRETAVIEDIGLAAWNALSEAQQTAAKNAVDFDARAVAKVEAARCNVKNAIEFIKCIPAPNPNPNNTPTGAAVADCLQKAWEKRRICIDFVSENAFGSMKPNCAGKARGVCDPDNNPINIAASTIPCTKKDKVYDPELYTLITTLYHEGIHALQAFDAKAGALPPGATPAERDAHLGTILTRVLKIYCAELETHGAENALIGVLCPEVLNVANGNPAAHGGHPYLKKVLDCFGTIGNVQARKDAAAALKKSLNDNKAANDSALAGYNAKKAILNNGGLNNMQKLNLLKKARRVTVELDGNKILAGGASGVVEQTAYDPVTNAEIPMDIATPLDEIYDLHFALDGRFLLVFGVDVPNSEGVLLAYSDPDGDGFLNPSTEQELIRSGLITNPFDIIDDPTNGQFLMVDLVNGVILALFEGPGLLNFDLLPDAFDPVGNLQLLVGEDFVERVQVTPDGNTIVGFPDISPAYPPFMLPEYPLVSATFNGVQFQPNPTVLCFDAYAFPPVFIEASGLPVPDTTSVINNLTTEVLIGGVPNSEVFLQILPPNPFLGPILIGPDGQALVNLPIPLEPEMELILQVFDPSIPFSPPVFENTYFVRDSTGRLINPVFDPVIGFSADLIGIPGLPYQIFSSVDLLVFDPLGPPLLGAPGPVPILPIPPDPLLSGLQLQAQTLVEFE